MREIQAEEQHQHNTKEVQMKKQARKLVFPFALLLSSYASAGTKVCEFNDPSTGTTRGCTEHSVGGSEYTIAYATYKDGKYLITVSKTRDPYSGSCTLDASGAADSDYYISSSDCSNYRIYTDKVFGKIYPKYKVLTVVYAPPGRQGGGGQSSVSYGSSSSLGSTFSLSKSFKSDYSVSVSGSVKFIASGDYSTSFGVGKRSASSQSMSSMKTASSQLDLSGPAVNGIDHDRDQIWLWLGPTVEMSMTPSAGQWTIEDTGEMDLQYVYVGHLKNPALMPPGVVDRLQAYGITPDDYQEILRADPLANGTEALNSERYQQLNLTFPYEPPYSPSDSPPTLTFTATYANGGAASRSVSNEYQVSSTSSGGVGFGGLFSAKVKDSKSWTWSDTDTRESSSGSSESALVRVGGPSFGYVGPTNMRVYYDLVYLSHPLIS